MKKFYGIKDENGILFTNKPEQMAEIIKAMHTIVQGINDERAYYNDWIIYGVPDCPTEDDFKFIAEDDDSLTDTLKSFKRIIETYFKFKE